MLAAVDELVVDEVAAEQPEARCICASTFFGAISIVKQRAFSNGSRDPLQLPSQYHGSCNLCIVNYAR